MIHIWIERYFHKLANGPCIEDDIDAKKIRKGIWMEMEAQSLSGLSHQCGGLNQVRLYLGL